MCTRTLHALCLYAHDNVSTRVHVCIVRGEEGCVVDEEGALCIVCGEEGCVVDEEGAHVYSVW